MSQPPDKVLCATDSGDDTQRRFRYQATQAAILALALVDDDTEVQELFCEQHEDILLKQRNGTFVGYQVKTRLEGLEPFKATDEETIHSIRWFISLDAQFRGYFTRFVLGSSCGFWKQRKNGSNLPYLLELAESTKNGTAPTHLATYVKKLCSKPETARRARGRKKNAASDTGDGNPATRESYDSDPPYEEALKHSLRVLKMVKAETLPSLRDIDAAVIKLLKKTSVIGDRLYSELETVAQALVTAMFNAASLAHESPREKYLNLCLNPSAVAVEEAIAGKRMDKNRLIEIIDAALPAQPTLCTSNHFSVESMPKGINRLEAKLAGGGLSVSNIDLAKDHKASADYFLAQLLQKHGRKTTDAQYQHLRTLVRTECQEAHDSTRRTHRPFGPAMLEEVRHRLRTRYQRDRNSLFGCEYEHLLGMAGILTEDCTLWWSDSFVLPEEVAS